MSKKSFWKMCPASKQVYYNRQREEFCRNMKILSGGMYTGAALTFVFGICICNFELLAACASLLLLAGIFAAQGDEN